MSETLQKLLGFSLVIFMAGNLLEMGLKLKLRAVGGALRDLRFLGLSLAWCFILCPALAWWLTKLIPLAEPYALGLLFLGMAPCAPFLPRVAQEARGELPYAAAFMLLSAGGTVVFMPLMVPLLVKGFAADAWTIAKPLVFYIAIPLAIGVAIRLGAEAAAEKLRPIVKKVTGVDTLMMVGLIVIIYGKDFVSAVGSYAIGSQILSCAVVTVASYGLGFGLPPAQKSVLALGVCTRNIGAAIAPLFSVPGTERRAIAMCALAVPITMIASAIAAKCFDRLAPALPGPAMRAEGVL